MQQSERIRSGGSDGRAELVRVSRDEDDARSLVVDVRDLFGFHTARRCGGRKSRLRQPRRAAVMWCSLIPAGVAFGHDCSHGPGPHPIKVLIQGEA
jgi:hypothetical protein